MYYFFEKDSRVFSFSCDGEIGYDTNKHVRVWVEDPSKIDMLYSYTLDTDDKTLIKGEECHAPFEES